MNMQNDGERFIPTTAPPYDVRVNLERYMKVLPYCSGKDVLELGCGCGLGTYLYSLVAKTILAVDYSEGGLAYANAFPFDPRKVMLKLADLTKEVPLGHFDVTIAVEFLEHIEDPAALLAKLDTEKLVFSLPLNSLKISTWHRYMIRNGDAGMQDIRDLVQRDFTIDDMQLQERKWVFGVATKKKA